MNPIIEKAKTMLSIHGKESFHPEILGKGVISPQAHNNSIILTDEDFNVLTYFTAVGSGNVYNLYKETQCQEIKDLLNYLDVILQKLPQESQRVVYRMDTYEDYIDNSKYISKYQNYIDNDTIIQIPWSLSVSIDNWNKEHFGKPIWEIELLPEKTTAHAVYPLLKRDKILHDQEKEVRFESNTIFQVTSVSTNDGFPYIQMRECHSIPTNSKIITLQ